VKSKNPRSAGAVVFRRTDRGIRVLVLRAFKNWDFPKGLVDAGEDQLAAAKREVAEETGLADLDWPFGEDFKETLPYGDHKKVARYYLCETGEHDVKLPVSPELGRPEHHEFRWVSFDAAQTLAPPRLQPIVAWARELSARPLQIPLSPPLSKGEGFPTRRICEWAITAPPKCRHRD
jgi:8-oxo-dGTP pyrophosphatase MutT (NUDIX family)